MSQPAELPVIAKPNAAPAILYPTRRLTPLQNIILEKLKQKKYNEVKLGQLTSLVNGVFNKDQSAMVKTDVIKYGVEWLINDPKTPKSSVEAYGERLIQKMRHRAGSPTTTSGMKKEARIIFQQVKDEIDITPAEDEEKHDDDDDKKDDKKDDKANQAPAPVPAMPLSALQMTNEAPPPATPPPSDPSDDGDFEEISDPVSGRSPFSHLSEYINSGTDFYKENKQTINKVLAALQQKNFDDGSYLTKLAALEYPEIEIFQQIVKGVGLGFDNNDKQLYENMLSPSKKLRDSVSEADRVRLTFKSIINPDQIGVLLKKGGEGLIQGAKDWWETLTTGKQVLSYDEKELQKRIDDRREKIDKNKNKTKAIDQWYGLDEKKSKPPAGLKPIGGGTGGGVVINPDLPTVNVDDSTISSYDILLPPNFKDYKNTSAGRNLADIMANVSTFGLVNLITKIMNPDKSIDFIKFKKFDPEGYKKYTEAMSEYNSKINKAGLEKDTAVDYKISKDYVDNTANITEELIKKAVASGKIDRPQAEIMYDLWDNFNDVKSGDLQISYDSMQQLQRKLFEVIPRDVLAQNKSMIDDYVNKNKEYISANWEGDSDLGNFDWIDQIFNPEVEDAKIKEKRLGPKKQERMIEPKYRYRGKWGGTDEIFERDIEEIEKRNLVIEVQRLREDLDTTNRLIQAQIMTDRRRFDNCFAPPAGEPVKYKALPDKFKREHRAIFQPTVIQNSIRPFEKNTRNEASFQQYKEWTPKEMQNTARIEMMSNPLIYPSNVDMATGGEKLYVAPAKDFNYILNQRFVK